MERKNIADILNKSYGVDTSKDGITENDVLKADSQMDKETAEQILQALEQDEQQTQEKMQKQQQGSKRRVEKDW